MEALKKIIGKFILLGILLVIFNFIYAKYFFESDLQKHSEIINLIRKVVKDSSEVVYLGESSNTTYGLDDADKGTISDFISGYFPHLKWGAITKEATHSGIYYDLLRAIPDNSNVKTVIVTMNLRSFDASWIYSNLETPLRKSTVLIKPYPPLFNRLLLSFKGYDLKSDGERLLQVKERWEKDLLHFTRPLPFTNVTEWDHAKATDGVKAQDGSIDYPLTELACHYIKTYAFQIDTLTNPRIHDFDKIVLLCKERGWKLIFNLLAENIQMADSLVGKDLTTMIKQNRDLLVKRYSHKGAIVVDNLEAVSNYQFIDKTWTTEHYFELGRRTIANNVAAALKSIYPNDYLVQNKEVSYFNDCEGNGSWGQMQTITNEMAFSGSHSCKVGGDQPYSITFASQLSNLEDSLTKISVSFKLFQKELAPEAKLVFEISDQNNKANWISYDVKDFSNDLNKWNEINYLYTLPNNFYNANQLKIYILNQGKSFIYIDDFKIQFLK